MKLHIPIFLVTSVLLVGCASTGPQGEDRGRLAVQELKLRSAAMEFAEAVKEGRLVFYATGSLVEGYTLPGLSAQEVADVDGIQDKIVNEFPSDPVPFWATQEYWDEVERFASEYNRMVYQQLKRHSPNTRPDGASAEALPSKPSQGGAVPHQ